jgi:hypothetical protein
MYVIVVFGGPLHICGVSKRAKQDHQKQQKPACDVSKGAKQDRQKQQ